ncbi:ShlB/FhaC/HecB family hemolysin secretion/activation protein [Vibrio aphrogenes]|uniref:ShlB/FhaC/HecB family hemolysin secretion/activation protein n=1 Tax=Vibrio aphrogenes TaxID=1891186 RepID=UPI0013DFC68C|nr:ShlB/FhaC/HecB family hemolysin secretion/activation protein [Vibrio aphrogenes]
MFHLFLWFILGFYVVCVCRVYASPIVNPSIQDELQQQQAERLKQIEQSQKQLQNLTPLPQIPGTSPITEDGQCFDIREITFQGNEVISSETLHQKVAHYKGQCLGLSGINRILHDISNFYIQKGYVTSRALLIPQDLSQGTLVIQILEGKLENILLNHQPHWFGSAFPYAQNRILNLRDIEQGLDQINRLARYNATIELLPGTQPGYTILNIKTVDQGWLSGSLGFNNGGQKNTGETQLSTNASLDDIFGLLDNWSISGSKSSEFSSYYDSQNARLAVSIPNGYRTFSYSYSYSDYLNTISSNNFSFESTGNTSTHDAALDWMLFRDDKQKIAQNVPASEGGNAVENTIGSLFNELSYITGGLTPSDATDGGIIAQLPVLLGGDDIVNKVLQVGTKDALKNKNMDDYVAIEESSYYLEASEQTQNELKGKGLYISKAPIIVQEGTATFQNGTNGMMNSEADAIKNVMSQTHNYGLNDINVLFNLNYNPTHGFIADGLESGVDKLGLTTGIAKQTGEFIRDTTTARGKEGSNFANHSQGNLLTLQGLGYINNKGTYDQGGFQDTKYFGGNIPTVAGFGSPVNTETMDTRVKKEVEFEFKGNVTNAGDFVGEVLGNNVGVNKVREQGVFENIFSLDTYKNLGLLFTEGSPHSSYRCSDNPNAVCGARP